MKSRVWGFSLIELLVVLAVIAVLAAIVSPVLTSTMDSKNSACIANCRKIGAAIKLYADDNNNGFVPAIQERYDNYLANYKTWRSILWPYVKYGGAYVCPAAPKSDISVWGNSYGPDSTPQNDVPSTFGINAGAVSCNSDYQGYYLHTISQYTRPSKLIVVSEDQAGMWACDFLGVDWPDIGSADFRMDLTEWGATYHSGKMNAIFADGHVKTMYLYDTIGNTPADWMWEDPQVPTGENLYPNITVAWIASQQAWLHANWPKNFPPFGGM